MFEGCELRGITVLNRRDIICRSGTINYLRRIHERSDDIKHIPFEKLLRDRVDLPVFRLPDGTVSKNLHQTFRAFVTETGLITCPRTGQNRTLYSLRHTYATFALLNVGMDIHALAIQMGTSIGMIELLTNSACFVKNVHSLQRGDFLGPKS